MASEFLSQQLIQGGHLVTISQARETEPGALTLADLIILASPSWDYQGKQGMPHEDYLDFTQKMAGTDLAGKPVAIMGLGDTTYQYYCGAVTHLEKLVADLNGKLVVPSLKLDQYYMNEAACTQAITDWAAQLTQTLQTQLQ